MSGTNRFSSAHTTLSVTGDTTMRRARARLLSTMLRRYVSLALEDG